MLLLPVQNTPGTTRRGFEKFCFQMINKPAFLSLLVFFSFCALFADDFRIAVCPKVHHKSTHTHTHKSHKSHTQINQSTIEISI